MSFSLEMLTKAADLVETQEKQKRLLESPDPTSDTRKSSNHTCESKSEESEVNGIKEKTTNGTRENHHQDHPIPNGRAHDNNRRSPRPNSTKTVVNNHDRHPSEDELRNRLENSSQQRVITETSSLPESIQYQLHQQRLAERSNGIESQRTDIKHRPSDDRLRQHQSPEHFHSIERRSTSPATDRGGETNSSTKPMVLLQPPTAATLSSVGSTHPAQLPNPALHAAAATMHHPYMYPMMYSTGVPLDPSLGAFARIPGAGLKEGEGATSSPNASPNNASLSAATAAGMPFPGLMYPLAANQALLMGARAPGAVSDISPLLLAQPSAAYPSPAGVAPNFLMEYKRLLEGMQFPAAAAYPIQSQLNEQYLRALMGQGIDSSKEALALSGMAGRLPPGMPLAALQGQPGANELLRYQEQLNSAMGLLRPQDGVSPRAASPYTKRRTESPVLPNGSKITTSTYPYHVSSLGQPTINSLSSVRPHVRSPAPMFPQGHRSRSPHSEARKSEVDRSGYRTHSRDLDREVVGKDLASTSASNNQNRNSGEHVAHSYSVTDATGRKIQLPAFYSSGASVHIPHGYPGGLSGHHARDDRSPSPHSRASDDRSYHRPSRERSPGGDIPGKRRSLDSQYRHSPALNDRHNSRPTSPTTNGQLPTVRYPLVNGSAEAAAELAKVNPHLLLPMGHARAPNQTGLTEGRDQRTGSPVTTNPYSLPPYLPPHLLGGLAGAGGSQIMMSQYAQALAGAAKGMDLASLYKAGENGADYSRLAGLPLSMALLPQQQQQQLIAAGRSPHLLQQDYAAALKAQTYLASQAAAKESGKSSPANMKDRHPALSQTIPTSLLTQEQSRALSPAKQGLKQKHSPSPQFSKGPHHQHMPDSHSPPGVGSSNSNPDGRRYMSPRPERRDTSPKPVASNKPYRPNPMLRDLERSRKRKLLEEEIAMGEEASNFRQGKQQQMLQQRQDQRDQLSKDAKKDPKRRKQLIADGDPDIEEHFRRSLGKDYKETSNKVSITGSVDDHFKKALGGVWDKLQTPPSTTPIKGEAREVVVPNTSALPSYSVAVAGGTVRGYPAYVESKEALRMYDPAYLASRERYHIQSLAAQHQQRRTEKSPPTAASSTVLYPTPNPPPVGPAKQRVKAKAVFPEAAASLGSDLSNRSARATSLGSKGSSRSVSGSSAESLPAALSKSPPTSSPINNSATEGIPRVPSQNAIPFTYTQPAGLPTTSNSIAVSHPQTPVIPSNRVTMKKPASPTSPRARCAEEQPKKSPPPSFVAPSGTKEPTERQPVENGKPST